MLEFTESRIVTPGLGNRRYDGGFAIGVLLKDQSGIGDRRDVRRGMTPVIADILFGDTGYRYREGRTRVVTALDRDVGESEQQRVFVGCGKETFIEQPFTCATVLPFATRLALPFLIMSIASIPRRVR